MQRISPELLEKYALGKCSPEEAGLVEKWLAGGDAGNHEWPAPGEDVQAREKRIWNNLEIHTRQQNRLRRMPPYFSGRFYRAVAACLVLLTCLAAVYFFKGQQGNDMSQNQLTVSYEIVTTRAAERREVVLPDSSRVQMNQLSTLRYPRNFSGGERRVELVKGEAFFSVQKDASRPFLMGVQGIEIKVLGTKFNVQQRRDSPAIIVTLTEGSIDCTVPGQQAYRLSPGQQLVYDTITSLATRYQQADLGSAIAWTEGKMIFKDAPMQEVLRQLAEKFAVQFDMAIDTPRQIRLTATFRDESLEKILHMIEKTDDIRFVRSGATIKVMY